MTPWRATGERGPEPGEWRCRGKTACVPPADFCGHKNKGRQGRPSWVVSEGGLCSFGRRFICGLRGFLCLLLGSELLPHLAIDGVRVHLVGRRRILQHSSGVAA